jgi:metal-responsive CopG/Arc/MetJ family transcriptional regulator
MSDETKDRHAHRVAVSLPKRFWDRLGRLTRNRSEVIRVLVAWYLREPGARLPERPPRQED